MQPLCFFSITYHPPWESILLHSTSIPQLSGAFSQRKLISEIMYIATQITRATVDLCFEVCVELESFDPSSIGCCRIKCRPCRQMSASAYWQCVPPETRRACNELILPIEQLFDIERVWFRVILMENMMLLDLSPARQWSLCVQSCII